MTDILLHRPLIADSLDRIASGLASIGSTFLGTFRCPECGVTVDSVIEHVPGCAWVAEQARSIGKSLSGDRPAETARELEHPSPSIAPAPAVDEDEALPYCGNCGQRTTFTEHENWSVDYETGYVQGKWLVCDTCGAETDESEVRRWNA